MKKFLLTAVLFSIILLSSACIIAKSEDEWKNNTGTVNLDTLTVSGEGISVSGNTVSITQGGDFEVTGTLEDGMIYVKADEKVKLRLSGMSITNTTGPAIFFDNAEKAFITITENTENYLTDGKEYSADDSDAALFSNDDLEIKGGGTLTVTGNYQHGIAGDNDVSIENGTIIINSYEHGIKANNTLSVLGGNITVKSETGKGMKADLEVIIDDGDINITSLKSEGIESKGTLTISGGNINITASDDGINAGNADTESSTFPSAEKNVPPDDRRDMGDMRGSVIPEPPSTVGIREKVNAIKKNDENSAAPDFSEKRPENGRQPGGGSGAIDEAAHAITINGGTIYINANGDGIDSNGNLTINGGEITIDGPLNSGNGPLDSDGEMSITGGTLILASSAGMIQLPRNEDVQNIISVTFSENQSANTEITIKETQSGEEIVSHMPAKDFRTFVFSSDKIEAGTEYTVYAGGKAYETVTAAQGITHIGSDMSAGFPGGGRGGFDRDNSVRDNSNKNISDNKQESKINLISNAYRYNKENGTVRVTLSECDNTVVFSVKDTGIGISEENIPKIFERFYQVDEARTSDDSGSMGLGLSMVKWIAEKHRGSVSVSSTFGVGSEFVFTFPKHYIV